MHQAVVVAVARKAVQNQSQSHRWADQMELGPERFQMERELGPELNQMAPGLAPELNQNRHQMERERDQTVLYFRTPWLVREHYCFQIQEPLEAGQM